MRTGLILCSLIWILVGCSAVRSKNGEEPLNPMAYADSLLESFRSFCPTTGSWTTNSIAEMKKIQDILSAEKEDPSCINLGKAITNHVRGLTGALERIEKDREQRDIAGLQRQQMDILSLLDRESDPLKVQELKDLFMQNRLSLSLKRGTQDYDRKRAEHEYLVNTIVNSSAEFFRQAVENRQCLINSPNILSGVISILGNLGAALSTGGTSLVFAGSASIMGNTFEYLRQSELDSLIRDFGQGVFVSAYQCVLESLSNQWCEAREVYELLDKKMQTRVVKKDSFSRGMDIINRDFIVLSRWLNEVRVGTPPDSLAAANKQVDFVANFQKLDKWRRQSIGRINDIERQLPKHINSPEEKKRQFNLISKKLIPFLVPVRDAQLLPGQHVNTLTHPLFEIVSNENILKWTLAGVPIADVPPVKDFQGNITHSLGFAPESHVFLTHPTLRSHYPFNINTIRKVVQELYSESIRLFLNQRSENLHTDIASVLADAKDEFYDSGAENIKNLSPVQAIDNIVNYFMENSEMKQQGQTLSCQSFFMDYLAGRFPQNNLPVELILCEIKRQIELETTDYSERLNKIFLVGRLGSGLLTNRVQKKTKNILMNILVHRSDDYDFEIQQKLILADEIITDLNLYRSSPLTAMKFDIRSSLRISEGTLQNFAELFAPSLSATVKVIYDKSKADSFYEQDMAKYCSLLLSIPKWNTTPAMEEMAKEILPLCEGLSLRSEWGHKRKAFEFPFSLNKYKEPFSREKICHFRRFLRQELIYQSYNITHQ